MARSCFCSTVFPSAGTLGATKLPALAARFRVVAPDLRGYFRTDKPPGGYDFGTLGHGVHQEARAPVTALLFRHFAAG